MNVLDRNPDDLVQYTLQCEGNAVALFGLEVVKVEAETKRVYKRLALKLHPDKNSHGSASQAFQVLQTLFEQALSAIAAGTPLSAPTQAQSTAPQKKQHHQPQQQQQHQSTTRHAPPPQQPAPPQPAGGWPPPPPPRQPQQRSTHRTTFEEVPLPPNIFEDMEWDDWTDQVPRGNAKPSASSGFPPPPPPPPPQHFGRPPPPPPPPMSAGRADPPPPPPGFPGPSAAGGARKASAPPLPSLSDDEGDSGSTRGPHYNSKQKKQSQKSSHAMPSLDTSSDDDDGDSAAEAQRKAQLKRRREKERLAAVQRAEAEREEAARSRASQSLKQLFATFGISDDEEELPGRRLPRGEAVHSTSAPTVSRPPQPSPASPTANSKTKPSLQSFPIASSSLSIPCPTCTTDVPIPLGMPQGSPLMCRSCRKFFVPTDRRASGASKPGRCRCGRTERGKCIMCNE